MAMQAFPPVAPGREAGVVLFVALIVLVAMSFAGLAIMRSVGSSVLVASNLAFKQTTTAGAERGVEAAKAWLLGQAGGALNSNNLASGYYSGWTAFNPLTFNWNASPGVATLAADAAGTSIRYVIHRLCQEQNAPIDATGQHCVMKSTPTITGGGSAGGPQIGQAPLKTSVSPYYRVTVRSEGPKNAISYVQVIFD